jgi:hypothetical protein
MNTAEQEKQDALAIVTPMELLVAAAQKADPETLAKLLDVQLRWEANEQRKAYEEALFQFRTHAPEILKTKKVSFKETTYYHAELDRVYEALVPELGKYGLSFGWNPLPSENGKAQVGCVIAHRMGHRQTEAIIEAPPDTSGSKNNVQAIGSTMSYLQRYTLLMALGIAPKGIVKDDDGKSAEGLPDQTVQDYVSAIEGAHEVVELQQIFGEAWNKAKACNDKPSMDFLRAAYDKRKKFFASQTRGAK